MDDGREPPRIAWYRSPIDRDLLADLNRRSDLWGLAQTLGHLLLLTATGAAAWWASIHWPWPAFAALLFVHGTFYAFLSNGFHELVHSTVFRSRALNGSVLRLFSFLGWFNPHHFWTSHTEHHKFTLHPPADLEVVLPQQLTLRQYLRGAVVNPLGLYYTLRGTLRRAFGRTQGTWECYLFPPQAVDIRRALFGWDRFLLVGHAALVAGSLWQGWWQLPVLITLAPFYGGWLQAACNNTQHIGLTDEVADFRLCTRTVRLGPFVQFLYWHMNFHIEHHMYAGVPCYRLGRLHRAIRHDLPHCPQGLIAAWREIVPILRRQRAEPDYEFVPQLPAPAAAL